jgi:alkylation response protein AidB-like acyl-CoA dehydrogenase
VGRRRIALPPIAKFGTEEQKRRYLAPGLRGELIAALAITEPGAGSDVAGIRTRARRVDGGWVVNGAKTYITGGVRADGPGITPTPLRKLGWHASDTAEIALDDVFVPEQNLLGAEHHGFYEAGRDMTYAALRRHLAGADAVREVTMAKLATQRAAVDVIDACLQIHGLDAPPELERAAMPAWDRSAAGPTRSCARSSAGRWVCSGLPWRTGRRILYARGGGFGTWAAPDRGARAR